MAKFTKGKTKHKWKYNSGYQMDTEAIKQDNKEQNQAIKDKKYEALNTINNKAFGA